jgi:hypothetical protein
MDRDRKIDAETLRKLIARLAAAKVDSIGLLGSTGTYMYLSREERRWALALAVEETGGRIPIVVGVGALRTDEAVRLAQDAKALGATAGLLAAVSYAPLTVDEVFEHFSTVARESKLSIVIHDNRVTTHLRFTPALVSRLAKVSGIVAIKNPTDNSDEIRGHLAWPACLSGGAGCLRRARALRPADQRRGRSDRGQLDLSARNIITCAEAMNSRDGRWVYTAGLVLVRQKPGSAKGVMFITIEDETGPANLVVWPTLFEKRRRVVLDPL